MLPSLFDLPPMPSTLLPKLSASISPEEKARLEEDILRERACEW